MAPLHLLPFACHQNCSRDPTLSSHRRQRSAIRPRRNQNTAAVDICHREGYRSLSGSFKLSTNVSARRFEPEMAAEERKCATGACGQEVVRGVKFLGLEDEKVVVKGI